jgi:hypothetical protein
VEFDVFKDILAPVIGGLGIFMLGLEFMSNGIHDLAVNRMRDLLARIAGTPIKGVLAGTLITGILQSSTAMTVMVVGLVNAGVLTLRPAIAVIMGANIGTTQVLWSGDDAGSIQYATQFSWLGNGFWASGDAARVSSAGMVFTQLRYNLP